MTVYSFGEQFKRVFRDNEFNLPIIWDGDDFESSLNDLFDKYIDKVGTHIVNNTVTCGYIEIKYVCKQIIECVKFYLNGLPAKAYDAFADVMRILICHPLKIYQKSTSFIDNSNGNDNDIVYFYKTNDDPLKLFRAVPVDERNIYQRERVFHTPYNLRNKVSSSRYSIAGFPSMYLATSLELCCNEIHVNPDEKPILASFFRIDRNIRTSGIDIKVIELGIKPQDFVGEHYDDDVNRNVPQYLLSSDTVKSAYLLWYPLIAASSYIRNNKETGFAPEYIVPQLLMQWVRTEMQNSDNYNNNSGRAVQLYAIRYFSCASEEASDMGFNYVFPSSGKMISKDFQYCKVLSKAFKMTNPVYIDEYDTIELCENALLNSRPFCSVGQDNEYYL